MHSTGSAQSPRCTQHLARVRRVDAASFLSGARRVTLGTDMVSASTRAAGSTATAPFGCAPRTTKDVGSAPWHRRKSAQVDPQSIQEQRLKLSLQAVLRCGFRPVARNASDRLQRPFKRVADTGLGLKWHCYRRGSLDSASKAKDKTVQSPGCGQGGDFS